MKRTILLASVVFVLGCGGGGRIVSARGAWQADLAFAGGPPAALTMSIAQDDCGFLRGTAALDGKSGVLTGEINGDENAYISIAVPGGVVLQMQVAGLPRRLFGSAWLTDGRTVATVAFEASRQ